MSSFERKVSLAATSRCLYRSSQVYLARAAADSGDGDGIRKLLCSRARETLKWHIYGQATPVVTAKPSR